MPMQVWMNELNGKLRKRLRISFQLPSRTCPKFQAETASCVPPDGARSRRLITGLEMRLAHGQLDSRSRLFLLPVPRRCSGWDLEKIPLADISMEGADVA